MKVYKWLEPLEDTEENPITRQRLVDWMSKTGYVEGYIHKKISPMDKMYVEDYIQECWIQILEVPDDKMVEIYRKGKGKFTNYIKTLINNNIRSRVSHLYKNIRADKKNELYLDDAEWSVLLEGEPNTTADVVFPTINTEYRGKSKGWLDIDKEKINIRADQELYEQSKEIEDEG